MPQYLCMLRARATFLHDKTPAEDAIIGRHFAYLCDLLRASRLLMAGRTTDAPPVGLVVFVAAEEAEARATMAADPAVAAGLFTPEIRPYRIALADVPRTEPPG